MLYPKYDKLDSQNIKKKLSRKHTHTHNWCFLHSKVHISQDNHAYSKDVSTPGSKGHCTMAPGLLITLRVLGALAMDDACWWRFLPLIEKWVNFITPGTAKYSSMNTTRRQKPLNGSIMVAVLYWVCNDQHGESFPGCLFMIPQKAWWWLMQLSSR